MYVCKTKHYNLKIIQENCFRSSICSCRNETQLVNAFCPVSETNSNVEMVSGKRDDHCLSSI